MAMQIIIRIGTVPYESKETNENIDEYPELNIYEKIQILIYKNIYLRETDYKSPINNNLSKNDKTIPIPITKPRKN